MLNILCTGSSGMVGHAIKSQLSEFNLYLTDKDGFDVTNRDVVMKKGASIDYIIHLAAETDLEACEKNPAQAYFVNAIGCAHMAELAQSLDIPIFYISTAGVFDGMKESPYTKVDKPNPINHYGRSKYYGEFFIDKWRKHYILRASWMMGGGPKIDKKFVNKLYRKIVNGETEINVCDDVIGSPTYTMDLAKMIKSMIRNQYPYGLYHCAGVGSASRFEVAREIVKHLGLSRKVHINPVKSDIVAGEFPCLRSRNEVLENSCMPEMRYWETTLKEYVDGYFKS